MSNQTKKNQHFIPKLHLNNFKGNNPQGHVWSYNKKTAEQNSAIPEETGFSRHFYSIKRPDGSYDTTVEDVLAKIESDAAPVYRELLNGKIPSGKEKLDFALFLSAMYSRTPAMRRMYAEGLSQGIQIQMYATTQHPKAFASYLDSYEKRTGKSLGKEEQDKLREDLTDLSKLQMLIPRERTLQVLQMTELLANILHQMNWALLIPESGFLITSDNPLLRDVDSKTVRPVYGGNDFNNKTCQVIFPLSPHCLFFASWNKGTASIANISREHVDIFNESQASNSEAFLYSHVHHKKIVKLSEKYKEERPLIQTSGLRPKKFAKTKIVRHSK
jgi:hypothetical protein